MTFTLPRLAYPMDGLAPHMSAETMEYHYGKHHQAYVDKLNELVAGSLYEGLDLEQVIRNSAADPGAGVLFNQAGQHFNHSHFWAGMRPNGGGAMPGRLERQVIEDFGSVAAFRQQFADACVAQFGSGWGWLVWDGARLQVTKTANADTPLVQNHSPLLTCDVWEHSYYIDYRNLRAKYVGSFLDELVDWQVVSDRLEAVIA